jgi:hypothetical protein
VSATVPSAPSASAVALALVGSAAVLFTVTSTSFDAANVAAVIAVIATLSYTSVGSTALALVSLTVYFLPVVVPLSIVTVIELPYTPAYFAVKVMRSVV